MVGVYIVGKHIAVKALQLSCHKLANIAEVHDAHGGVDQLRARVHQPLAVLGVPVQNGQVIASAGVAECPKTPEISVPDTGRGNGGVIASGGLNHGAGVDGMGNDVLHLAALQVADVEPEMGQGHIEVAVNLLSKCCFP